MDMGRTHIPGRGKAGTKAEKQAGLCISGCEYFGLTGGSRTIAEVKAKESGEAESMKILTWEFVFTWAFLVGHGGPAKHFKQETQN